MEKNRYELNVNSCYGEGIEVPEAYVSDAKRNGLGGIALTDMASVKGCSDVYNSLFNEEDHLNEEDSFKLILGIRAMLAEHFISDDISDNVANDMVSRYCGDITILVKNNTGRSNLLKMVKICSQKGNMENGRFLKIETDDLVKYRQGLLIGYSFKNNVVPMEKKGFFDGLLKLMLDFLDYIEITPYDYNPAFSSIEMPYEDWYQEYIKGLIDFAGTCKKTVVAVSGAMYLHPEKKDEWLEYFESREGLQLPLEHCATHKAHLRMTEELLDSFSFLGHEIAKDVVIDNTEKIASQIRYVKPLDLVEKDESL